MTGGQACSPLLCSLLSVFLFRSQKAEVPAGSYFPSSSLCVCGSEYTLCVLLIPSIVCPTLLPPGFGLLEQREGDVPIPGTVIPPPCLKYARRLVVRLLIFIVSIARNGSAGVREVLLILSVDLPLCTFEVLSLQACFRLYFSFSQGFF